MFKLNGKKECYGCAACKQICPKQCIIMEEDSEGFLYPKVDQNSCVHCGMCERVCPTIQMNIQCRLQKNIIQAYIAYINNDAIRLQSSSGGVFTVLAEQIIDEGGVVFGAAFDAEFMVHHICVTNLNDLCKLRGSKYLQSRMENAYAETKKYLSSGRKVLFSGTACQLAGLKWYLGKEYENLLTVDVLCHGVPSPKLWHKYLKEQEREHGAKTSAISFRNKDTGWKTYSVQIEFDDHTKYEQLASKDAYMRLFLSDICLRPSCHNCRFKEFPRVSDITLGDCWGVENHSPEMNDNKGVSVIIINTDKGQKLRDLIADSCTWKKSDIDILLPPNSDSRRSVNAHKNRDILFKRLDRKYGICELLKTIEPSLTQKIKYKLCYIKRKLIR